MKKKKVCKDCGKVFCGSCSKRDLSDLDDRFTSFFESGERVEVEWSKIDLGAWYLWLLVKQNKKNS